MQKKILTLCIGIGSGFLLYLLAPIALAGGAFYIDSVTGYIGIGNTTPASSLDVSGAMYSRLVTASSTAIDWNAGNVQSMTLSSSPTLTFSNGQAGGKYDLILNQDATGGRTITWPASVLWAGGMPPTLTSNANAIDEASFVYDGSHYLGSYELNYASMAPSTLPNGLVAYWKLDGNSNDATGNGHNGSDTGITYSGANGIINDGAGLSTASSSVISVSDSTALKPVGNFTINAWVKVASGGSGASVFQSYSQNTNVAGIRFSVGSYGFDILSGKNTGTTLGTDFKEVTSGPSLADNTWHMVTYVYNGTTLLAYEDGNSSPIISTSWSQDPQYAATNYVLIGNETFNGTLNSSTDGDIDEVGFWNRALSTSEISQLYNSGSGNQYPF